MAPFLSRTQSTQHTSREEGSPGGGKEERAAGRIGETRVHELNQYPAFITSKGIVPALHRRSTRWTYALECVEGKFSEVRIAAVQHP